MTEGSSQAPFPNLWQGVGVALVYLASGHFTAAFGLALMEALGWPTWIPLAAAPFVSFTAALAFSGWLGSIDPWDFMAFDPVRPGIWLPLLAAHAGLFILILSLGHGLLVGLERVLPPAMAQALFGGPDPLVQAPHWARSVVVLAAVLPEEAVFRGMILRGFLGRMAPLRAIWLATAYFAVAHGNVLQFPVAAAIGATAGWYYWRTGSLWPGIAAHAIQNFLAAWFIDPGALKRGSIVVLPLPAPALIAVAPFALLASLLILRWQFTRNEHRT
jgi:membrane protease YdiL (CAAX protease family)